MQEMVTLKAIVKNGHLVTDKPVNYPEGTELELVVVEPEEELDPEERAALNAVLADLRGALGAERRAVVACNLTTPNENIVRGTVQHVLEHFQKNSFKGEFSIIIAGKQRTP